MFKNSIIALLIACGSLKSNAQEIIIPLAGNAFSSKHAESNKTVTNKGIENWKDSNESFTCYFRVSRLGNVQISIPDISNFSDSAILNFTVNGISKKVAISAQNNKNIKIGNWKIADTGYVAVKIKGVSKAGFFFPSIENLKISGTAVDTNTHYVKDNAGNFFYWGRRGPSVHLNYIVPENSNIAWYYNEITVPVGQDVIGSYYMATGFGEGYFGFQVNSSTERRILFSVWSPFKTDDPKNIPEEHKIVMLNKGKGVHTGEFGNEGSGGQSYLKFNWKAGSTYKFLLKGVPSPNNTTTYTAWFFAPENNRWQLIASFKRPQTSTYLKRFHSFLENFIPQTGAISRRAQFNNQWVADMEGNWTEITQARFTTDNTGNKKYRMDFAGGADNKTFFLKNCGFFSDFTNPKTIFTRSAVGAKPIVDLNELPQ